MVLILSYDHSLSGKEALLFKIADEEYEVIWAELLDNETTNKICRKLKKCIVDFGNSPPTWGSIIEKDIATPSGLTNPMVPHRGALGYDFDSDEILVTLGEWNEVSSSFECTLVKLLAVKRDFSSVTVLHNDLLALAQESVTDATVLKFYIGFSGYGGKIVGGVGTYAGANERSCIITYNGTIWASYEADSRYNFIQEAVEPIWSAENVFLGWLTEGHGTNSHFIDTSLNISTCYPSGTLFTVSPIYDPINHKVIWIEWGSATGTTQHIFVADPDADAGCINFVDKTPSGTITDNEENTIDLGPDCKANGVILSDGENLWFTMLIYDNPDRVYKRIVKVDLGFYDDDTKYAVLADPSNDDKYVIDGILKTIDPANKLFLPAPLMIIDAVET